MNTSAISGSKTISAIDRFTVNSVLPSSFFPTTRLLLDNTRRLRRVFGDELAAQFQIGELFIVVTTYDYYDAASHWFHLVRGDGKIIDAVATPDYFGFIQDVDTSQPGKLSFGFFGTNDRWTLQVHGEGFWSFRYRDLARRMNWFLLSKRYLTLLGTKGPPWQHD